MAEVSNKVQVSMTPHLGKYQVWVEGTKAAQDDILTVSMLKIVKYADLKYDASGVLSDCAATIQNDNELKLTDVTTGDVRGIVVGSK